MKVSTPYMTSNTDAAGNRVYPAWLIEAIPGAAEAKAALDDAAASLTPLSAAQRAAIKAAVPLGRWRDGVYGPNDGVTMAQFDAAQGAKRDADLAVKRESRRVASLRKQFDDVMAHGLDPDARRRLGAETALAAQAEAVAALSTLRAALAKRDSAWNVAGAPGQFWGARSSAPADYRNAQAQAEHLFGVMVDGFDVDAVERTLAGEEVPTLRTLADRMKAAQEALPDREATPRRTSAGF